MIRGAYSLEPGRSRTGRIYGQLRDDIIQGKLAPGSKLKIEVLKARYEIGATPIREALSLLTADGLVERLEQRGFRVAEASAAEFEQLRAIRCWIEERALRLSIRTGGRDWEGVVLARRLASTPRVRRLSYRAPTGSGPMTPTDGRGLRPRLCCGSATSS